jgi:hypothetical protein
MENSEDRLTADEIEFELMALRSMRDEGLKKAQQYRGRADLKTGIILGLLYGIIGNFAVQHWYGVFEGLETGVFSYLFWSNVVVLIIAVIIIIALSIYFRKQVRKDTINTKNTEEQVKMYENIMRKRELSLARKAKKD